MIRLLVCIMTTKSGSDCKISHRRSGGSKGEAVEYILDISAQGQAAERCSGPAYQLFLDYAFTQADFFMLAFVNYYGKGLPAAPDRPGRSSRRFGSEAARIHRGGNAGDLLPKYDLQNQLLPLLRCGKAGPAGGGQVERLVQTEECGGSGLFQGRPMLVLLGRARTDRGLSARDGGRPAVCARKWLGGASLSAAVFRIL